MAGAGLGEGRTTGSTQISWTMLIVVGLSRPGVEEASESMELSLWLQQAAKENMGKGENLQEEGKIQESRTSSSTSGSRVLKDSNLVLAKAQLSRSGKAQSELKPNKIKLHRPSF